MKPEFKRGGREGAEKCFHPWVMMFSGNLRAFATSAFNCL